MFIGRRQDGKIYGAWSSKQPNDVDHPGVEEVADNNLELLAFLMPQPAPKRISDGELAGILISKGLLTPSDLP